MNGKKVNIDFKSIWAKIASFFKNFGRLPKDEQYAYVAIGVGAIFIILGLIV
jgi:hypothetical protein